MSSIDERVVQMKFDNAQFERGVKETTSSLDKLKKGLSLDGAKKGLSGLAQAGKNFTLGGIGNAVQDIAGRFTALGIVGVTALANIANRAVDAGVTLAKSLTVDPIMDGLREYELNLNSIQTILANTQSKGSTLEDVNGALAELNEYADQTIYNFAEMSRNIGTFTAAGVDLDTSTAAIKGIANLAALSGSNSQQASTAMYQLSQAMSSGTVRLMDWNSVVNAGMGGQVFQDALVETARNQGISVDDFIKKNGSFRESLQEEWLTTEVMTETLAKFTGDLSTEQLKQMGYTDEQIGEIIKLGETASDAATKVKTMSQLLDTLKEAVGSGWAETWQLVFGDFEEAKELFTAASETLGGMVDTASEARNELIGGWKEMGGRDVLIESVANAFEALMAILKPVKDAFTQIFPPLTAQTLYDMTVALRDFTETLKIGEGTTGKLQRTFAGFFAVLGIGWEILKGALGLLADLFGIAQEGSGSFLDVTASLGDFLVALHEIIKSGGLVTKVFDGIGVAVKVILSIVSGAVGALFALAKAIAGVFSGDGFKFEMDFNPMASLIEKIKARFEGFAGIIDKSVEAAKGFISIVEQVWNVLARGDFVGGVFDEDSPVIGWLFTIREAFEEFWGWITGFFSGMDFNTLLDVFNTGLFAGLVVLFGKFFGDIKGILSGDGGGIIGSIVDIFDNLTGTLEAMQNNLRANTLIKIAGAIAILAAAVLVLSLIDSEDLTKALTAMTVMFTQLFVSMAVFEKATASAGFAKMPLVAASMILLAIAINILAIAVKQMSDLNWDELAKGLLGVAGVLGLLAGWALIMDKQSGSLIRASAAMILVGVAVKILASSVEQFGEMDWESLNKGILAIGGILAAVAGFNALGGGGTLKGAASMIIVGAALTILSGVVIKFGEMDTENIVKGLVTMAGALAIIAGAMYLMTGAIAGAASMLVIVAALWVLTPLLVTMGEMSWEAIGKAATLLAGSLLIIAGAMYLMTGIIAGAASMLVVVAALWVLVPLLVQMGEMSWEEIGKAATMLAGSLVIIAGAMYLMTGALPGAAALIVVAAALAIMIPVLIGLSQLTWGELLVGLAGLAGVFLVLGAAGLVLAPVIPSIMLLGVAITLLGIGALAAGAGILAFSIGFTALVAAVSIGSVALVSFIKQLIGLIPYAAQQIGLGIVAVANVISQAGPAWTRAMVTVLMSLIIAIRTVAPMIINTLFDLIMLMADTLQRNVPTLVEKGLQLLLGILRGIRDNIYDIVVVAGEIIVNFINGINNQLPKITAAGYDLIITFIESLADTIRNNQSRMDTAGRDLASAIIDGMTSGLRNGVSAITSAARDVASNALDGAKDFLGIKSPSREFMKIGEFSDQGFAAGLTEHADVVGKASEDVGDTAMTSLKKSISGLSKVLDDEMTTDPVIRPVMDLSDVRKGLGSIDGMSSSPSINADLTKNSAYGISRDMGQPADVDQVVTTASPQGVSFIQNNYSPKALSRVEIYRNTKNLVSTVKSGG